MSAFERLTLAIETANNASGGVLLPVVALLAIVVVLSAVIALAQTQGGRRG